MMTKDRILIAFLLLSISSYAQVKGRMMINGNASYYRAQVEQKNGINAHISDKNQFASANLNLGYFISNNFAIGIKAGTSSSNSNSFASYTNGEEATRKNSGLRFSSGVFARYNKLLGDGKFGLFLQLDNLYNWGTSKSESRTIYINFPPEFRTSNTKLKGYSSVLFPGVLYFINKKLSLEASFGSISYHHTMIKDKEETANFNKSNGFNLNFSLSTINLGLTFYFGKGKSETSESETKVGE